jgi:hypothetical protein
MSRLLYKGNTNLPVMPQSWMVVSALGEMIPPWKGAGTASVPRGMSLRQLDGVSKGDIPVKLSQGFTPFQGELPISN